MTGRLIRQTLISLNAFLAFTAIAGGIGLLTGVIAPPLALLDGSPFPSYGVPGFALLVIVGGSALAAVIALHRRHQAAALVSGCSAMAILGFEIIEVIVIGSPAGPAHDLQIVYVALGLLIMVLSLTLALRERPGQEGPMVKALALVTVLSLVLATYFLFVRPWYLQWGATPAEARQTLPGDEIISDAAGQVTRAITIDAPTRTVWPWVAQIGQDRGGFYSFDLLENMVGCEMPIDDQLRAEHQSWAIGDRLWMYPATKAGGIGYATLRVYVPGSALGFATHAVGTSADAEEDGSWTFVVQDLDGARTRFLSRGRRATGGTRIGTAFDRSIFEPMHFVMERRMMMGLKQVAEGETRGRWLNHAQVVLWSLAFGLMPVSAVLVFRRKDWTWPLIGFALSAVVFEILTLGQPPLAAGVVLTIGVAAVLWWRRSP